MQGICKKNSTILSRHPEITGRYEYYTTNPRTFVPDCLCAMYMYPYSITYSRLKEKDLQSLCQKHSTAL